VNRARRAGHNMPERQAILTDPRPAALTQMMKLQNGGLRDMHSKQTARALARNAPNIPARVLRRQSCKTSRRQATGKGENRWVSSRPNREVMRRHQSIRGAPAALHHLRPNRPETGASLVLRSTLSPRRDQTRREGETASGRRPANAQRRGLLPVRNQPSPPRAAVTRTKSGDVVARP
jgi:hypothetical protein